MKRKEDTNTQKENVQEEEGMVGESQSHTELVCSKCMEPQTDEIVELKKSRGYKERFVRLMADFENFKHRVEKDRQFWDVEAKAEVLKQLLPVFDDLERAIESAPKLSDKKALAWLEGVCGIQKNLKKILDKLGVREIDCSGQFDPELHEALCQVSASDDTPSGKIVQVLRRGYKLGEHNILRHAQVSVAR